MREVVYVSPNGHTEWTLEADPGEGSEGETPARAGSNLPGDCATIADWQKHGLASLNQLPARRPDLERGSVDARQVVRTNPPHLVTAIQQRVEDLREELRRKPEVIPASRYRIWEER